MLLQKNALWKEPSLFMMSFVETGKSVQYFFSKKCEQREAANGLSQE